MKKEKWDKELDEVTKTRIAGLIIAIFGTRLTNSGTNKTDELINAFLEGNKAFIRKLLSDQKKEIKDEIDEMIVQRMRDYSNQPLKIRKGTFNELGEVRDEINKLLEEK